MQTLEPIQPENSALLLIDVQERLFPHMDRGSDVMGHMQKMLQGAEILKMPIFVTEQYPKGLGATIVPIKSCLKSTQNYLPKMSFSCLGDEVIANIMMTLPVKNWILLGIEAHICVLQTARDLKRKGKQVIAVNDAMTSRSIFDFSTAISEMRDLGIRITSTETILFDLLGGAQSPHFKEIAQLFKERQLCCSVS